MAKRKNKGPFTIDEVDRLNEIGMPVKDPITTANMLVQEQLLFMVFLFVILKVRTKLGDVKQTNDHDAYA